MNNKEALVKTFRRVFSALHSVNLNKTEVEVAYANRGEDSSFEVLVLLKEGYENRTFSGYLFDDQDKLSVVVDSVIDAVKKEDFELFSALCKKRMGGF